MDLPSLEFPTIMVNDRVFQPGDSIILTSYDVSIWRKIWCFFTRKPPTKETILKVMHTEANTITVDGDFFCETIKSKGGLDETYLKTWSKK